MAFYFFSHNSNKHFSHISRKLYAEERFPPFVYGPIYLISREAVTNILINAQKVGCFPLEDVLFTGIVRKNANMDIVDVFDHFRTRSEVIYLFVYSAN